MGNETAEGNKQTTINELPRIVRLWDIDVPGAAIILAAAIPAVYFGLATVNALRLEKPMRAATIIGSGLGWALALNLAWYLSPIVLCIFAIANFEVLFFLSKWLKADIAVFQMANPNARIEKASFFGACAIGLVAMLGYYIFSFAVALFLWVLGVNITP